MFRYKDLSHTNSVFGNYMYKKTRMELLDIVFENKEIFSDQEYLSLMNTQWKFSLRQKLYSKNIQYKYNEDAINQEGSWRKYFEFFQKTYFRTFNATSSYSPACYQWKCFTLSAKHRKIND